MALILVKEDGTGLSSANTYADVADGNAYFDGHPYAGAWVLSADDRKAGALVMATRVIDAEFRFNGWRTSVSQALQWPRLNCPDPDRAQFSVSPLLLPAGNFLESNVVPRAIVDATCEMAKELMIVDRTAAAPGEGIRTRTTGAGASFDSTTYDKSDTRRILTPLVLAMLGRFGGASEGGVLRLSRA